MIQHNEGFSALKWLAQQFQSGYKVQRAFSPGISKLYEAGKIRKQLKKSMACMLNVPYVGSGNRHLQASQGFEVCNKVVKMVRVNRNICENKEHGM